MNHKTKCLLPEAQFASLLDTAIKAPVEKKVETKQRPAEESPAPVQDERSMKGIFSTIFDDVNDKLNDLLVDDEQNAAAPEKEKPTGFFGGLFGGKATTANSSSSSTSSTQPTKKN
jgi:hypothetical protein